MKPAGGKKAGAPLIKDASATAATNLTVLRRTDADVEEVLGTAGHVCLYGFDVDTKQWARAALRAWAAVCLQRLRCAAPHAHAALSLRRRAARKWRAPCSWSSGALTAAAARIGAAARPLQRHTRSRVLSRVRSAPDVPLARASRSAPRFQFIILNRLSTGAAPACAPAARRCAFGRACPRVARRRAAFAHAAACCLRREPGAGPAERL
jgi:hypothetical protein